MAKYVTRDVFDHIHELYVGPNLDYGDILYHRDDSEMSSNLKKKTP